MIRLTDTELAAIRADSEQFIPPGIGDTQRMLNEIAELKAECEGLRKAVRFAVEQFETQSSADGSGHGDIARAVMRIAGDAMNKEPGH